MRLRFSVILVSLLSLLIFSGSAFAGRSAPLVDPAPVAIPAGLSQEQVVKDIQRTLLGRGWQVAGEAPGKIDAVLYLRDHVANIVITYDAQNVRFAYVNSKNLDYRMRKGKPHIHSNYLSWVQNLVNDLGNNFQVSTRQ